MGEFNLHSCQILTSLHNLYILRLDKSYMGNKRRQKKNKQQGMLRRRRGGKKPMSEEQKKARKKISEAQREKALAENKAK